MKQFYTLNELKNKLPEPFPKTYLGVRRFIYKYWDDLKPITFGEKGRTNLRYFIDKEKLQNLLEKVCGQPNKLDG